jgi:hypothetical protein
VFRRARPLRASAAERLRRHRNAFSSASTFSRAVSTASCPLRGTTTGWGAASTRGSGRDGRCPWWARLAQKQHGLPYSSRELREIDSGQRIGFPAHRPCHDVGGLVGVSRSANTTWAEANDLGQGARHRPGPTPRLSSLFIPSTHCGDTVSGPGWFVEGETSKGPTVGRPQCTHRPVAVAEHVNGAPLLAGKMLGNGDHASYSRVSECSGESPREPLPRRSMAVTQKR